ncbi:hypothetical protein YQE_05740, partial [Dendroctonus ponderosae]
MVVARPIEPTPIDFETYRCSAPIVPTKILTDSEELDRHLLQNGNLTSPKCESPDESESPVSTSQIIVTPVDFKYKDPETEKYTVILNKNETGLGITVAGYVCEREDLNGIFIKQVAEESEAFKCNLINVNDRIIEVNGKSLLGLSNQQSVSVLKETGNSVQLTFERYLSGPKFEQLQEALATQERREKNSPSPSIQTLTWIPIDNNEGTVDVEDGVELRPRHYIRSILPEGPVGQNGKLSPGDEILEVNGQKLLGISHVAVVKILRELPSAVRLVCSRKDLDNRVINTSQDREAFQQRNILGGSLKNLLPQPEQRLIKALSDTSLHTSSTVTVTDEQSSLKKEKSRSLEITNVAMWSEEVDNVKLVKNDRGLGFSILDYQDPVDPKSTIIVVRSLVPNGPAEANGQITPGDRIISVNDVIIKNFTLDQAVQTLKGTLPGIVTLGISKPLPCSRQSEAVSSSIT